MRRYLWLGVLAATTSLMPHVPEVALAGEYTTTLSGRFNSGQENGCLTVALYIYRLDCQYRSRKDLDPPRPWVGPHDGAAYFSRGSADADPARPIGTPDRRVALAGDAAVTIDDRSTEDPGDDLVRAVFSVGAAARVVTTRVGRKTGGTLRAVESWSRLTHVMATTAVSSASAAPDGTTVYLVGQRGYPGLICRDGGTMDCFPSAAAPAVSLAARASGRWEDTARAPIGRADYLGSNTGASTVARFVDYRCRDNAQGRECASSPILWGNRAKPGLDNMLLRIVVTPHRSVQSIEGIWTHEFTIVGAPARLGIPEDQPNSWLGGFLRFSAPVL
jgi:hypothetical protein